jgi:HK97 family phage prohead protease
VTVVLSLDDFRRELRHGRAPAGTVRRLAGSEPILIDEASRRITLCFSDGSIDRMGDRIDPAGWELSDFRKNPVVLWCHDQLTPPIGQASNVRVQGTRLLGDVKFAPPELSSFADEIYRLLRAGYINACSVGFLPLEFSFTSDRDRPGGIDFHRQALLELSICGIPANPHALVDGRAMKSAAVDSAARIATLARLRDPPARPRSIERAADDLMPLNFCGIWADYVDQRERRHARERNARMLRLALRARPQTAREIQATIAEIERLRAIEITLQ